MTRPAIEVADIVRAKGRQFLERFKAILSYQVLKAYRAVERCRTAALGGHRDKCVCCGYETAISYNSCRSRCCPKCQAQARAQWLQAQQRDLLNTNYFHVVFTLPHELNPLALTSPRPFLDLLFDASSQTLLEVAADPKRLGAEIGFLSILHTWSQNLLAHYHVHCLVPAGGLSPDHQRWIPTSHPLFLLPIPILHTVFRKKFLARLRQLYRKNLLNLRGPAADFSDPAWFQQLMKKLENKDWFVYAAALRRPRTCPALSRPLHPPHGHQQPPPHRLRRRARQLPLARSCPRRQAACHDPRHRGVPAPFLPSRFAQRFRAHPPLRPAVEPLPQTAAAPGAHTARRSGPRAAASATLAESRPLALPPLQRSNARRRALHRRTTLFRRLRFLITASANPSCRLAARTSSLECAPSMQNSFISTFNPISKRLDCRQLRQLLTACHHHRRRRQPQEAFTQSRNSIQYP